MSMKNVLVSSRETDAKIFRAMLVIEALVVAAMAGYLSPTPLDTFAGRALNSSISFGLAVAAWACFRSFDPRRYSERWVFARLAGIPCLWLLLFGSVVAWIKYNHSAFMNALQEVLDLLNRSIL